LAGPVITLISATTPTCLGKFFNPYCKEYGYSLILKNDQHPIFFAIYPF
jgi:hypothetical protein